MRSAFAHLRAVAVCCEARDVRHSGLAGKEVIVERVHVVAQGAGHAHASDHDSPALVWQVTAAAAAAAVTACCCDDQRAPHRSLQHGGR